MVTIEIILSQVKNHEKQDLDKVLVSFWRPQTWEQEWQVSVTQLSNLMGHLKPSSPDQGWRTRTHRLLSWKDGLCMYINATALLQPSKTLPLCANSKGNRSLLCSSQRQDDPSLSWAPQLAIKRLKLQVQWTLGTITNRLKLHYELGQAVQHVQHR